MTPINCFIGFDPRETIAFHVLSNSIRRHATVPVAITPIALSNLKGVYTRERDPVQSTDFAFSRFLTPHIARSMGLKNKVVFMDSDMLFRADIAELPRAGKTTPARPTPVACGSALPPVRHP